MSGSGVLRTAASTAKTAKLAADLKHAASGKLLAAADSNAVSSREKEGECVCVDG